jgi:transposase, IS30 family
MSNNHLTPFERGAIQLGLEKDMKPSEIAAQLERPPSTVTREIARNKGRNGYNAAMAQKKYDKRRKECRPKTKMDDPRIRAYVVEGLRDFDWTPEIVSMRIKQDFPDDPHMRISHECIYQAIYREDSLRFLVECLAQQRPKRRKKGQGKWRRGPSIPNRVGIEHRPAHIETRVEQGHWEGDTIVGAGHSGFIVTLVERTSRLLHAIWVHTKNAQTVAQAIIGSLEDRPISWVRSCTFDNGTEFAAHEKIQQALGIKTYFAQPYCSWQRGTNENTNGLIRRYLPKRKSFADVTQRQVDYIVNQLNNRPRKCLGYRTPNEVFQLQRENHLFALRG